MAGEGIDARHLVLRGDEIARDRLSGPASEVEQRAALRHQRQKSVEPRPLEQVSPSIMVPLLRVAVVKTDDPVRIIGHRERHRDQSSRERRATKESSWSEIASG
jgi:hypothetical protein